MQAHKLWSIGLALKQTETEFHEFEPRLKSTKNWFQLSTVLNLENLEYNLKWNQPYLNCVSNLSHGSNSLNSASEKLFKEVKVDEYFTSLSITWKLHNFNLKGVPA